MRGRYCRVVERTSVRSVVFEGVMRNTSVATNRAAEMHAESCQ